MPGKVPSRNPESPYFPATPDISGDTTRGQQRHQDRERRFQRDIRAYCRKILAPLGLDAPRRSPSRAGAPWRKVFVGDQYVWKFYRRRSVHHAASYGKASELLQEAGVRVPEIRFSDTSDPTRESFNLACLVLERFHGRSLAMEEFLGERSSIAPLLVRLHSVCSSQYGPLASDRRRTGPEASDWFTDLRLRLSECDGMASMLNIGPIRGLDDWMNSRFERAPDVNTAFQLTHGDLTARNVMRLDRGGELAFIDLDHAQFRHFGSDLLSLMVNVEELPALEGGASAQDYLENRESRIRPLFDEYFSLAPKEARLSWTQSKELLLLHRWIGFYKLVLNHLTSETLHDLPLKKDRQVERLARIRTFGEWLVQPGVSSCS